MRERVREITKEEECEKKAEHVNGKCREKKRLKISLNMNIHTHTHTSTRDTTEVPMKRIKEHKTKRHRTGAGTDTGTDIKRKKIRINFFCCHYRCLYAGLLDSKRPHFASSDDTNKHTHNFKRYARQTHCVGSCC